MRSTRGRRLCAHRAGEGGSQATGPQAFGWLDRRKKGSGLEARAPSQRNRSIIAEGEAGGGTVIFRGLFRALSGRDRGVEIRQRVVARAQGYTVYNEGWCRGHLVILRIGLDTRVQFPKGDFILDASIKGIFVHSHRLRDIEQADARIAVYLYLIVIYRVCDRKIFVFSGAAGQQKSGCRYRLLGRIADQHLAGDVFYLSGVDVFCLEGWENFTVPAATHRTGNVCVFDHRNRGAGIAQTHIRWERHRGPAATGGAGRQQSQNDSAFAEGDHRCISVRRCRLVGPNRMGLKAYSRLRDGRAQSQDRPEHAARAVTPFLWRPGAVFGVASSSKHQARAIEASITTIVRDALRPAAPSRKDRPASSSCAGS